jgi:Spy/CpxP family protein refolding chaperone
MEEKMKKYKMIMFSILMSMLLIFPIALKAKRGMHDRDMKGEGEKMGEWHHDWFYSLNLDEDVLREIQEMRLDHKGKILDLKNQIEKKELEIEKVLIEKKLDFNKLLYIHDEISDLRQKISRQKLEQKIEMYKLIPDDKKEEAKRIFLHRFSRKSHKGSGMPGEPGRPVCPAGK